MRIWKYLAAIVLGVGLGQAAQAQSTNPFWGNAVQPTFVPISNFDTSQPIATPISATQPTNPNRFFNSSIGQITNQPVYGQSVFPSQNSLSTANLLSAFHVTVYQPQVPVVWWKPWTWF